ncbi:glycosyltransferase [Pontibacter harenae]|uniref:glycosyltransferase n=1 Tax=Pontibacter harenae TaxID=2894083 RepID=UPI001E2F191A|nr:glycosyltransferase [Pontibacter harenae]MCC9166160.1 glycosyl transferase family 28 [Pontibacter harenae]
MIFVTIGTQEPFDRLIKAIDETVPLLGDVEVIAQVSNTGYLVKNMKTLEFVSPTEFNTYFAKAKLIISHAGMGTILSALVQEKPIIVMPRLAKLGEHRNEHQLATANRFNELGYINVAYDEADLKSKVLAMVNTSLEPLHKIGYHASDQLISSLQESIERPRSGKGHVWVKKSKKEKSIYKLMLRKVLNNIKRETK